MKKFSVTRGGNIRSDIFWMKNFVKTNLKIIFEDNF